MGNSVSKDEADKVYQPKGNYALASDLNKYQPKGNYLSPPQNDEFTLKSYTDNTYQPKGNYALASDLNKYQPKGDYVLSSNFDNFQNKFKNDALEFNLSLDKKYQPKAEFDSYKNAVNNSLTLYTPKAEFDSYKNAVNNSLTLYTPKAEFDSFQKKFKDEFQEFSARLDKKYQPISSNNVTASVAPMPTPTVSIPFISASVAPVPPPTVAPFLSSASVKLLPSGDPVKYIRFTRTNAITVMNIAQAQAYDNTGNLIQATANYGPNGNASGYDNNLYPASKLIDGTSFAHTAEGVQNYIQMNFASPASISKLVITNRKDCCKERMIGIKISFFDSNDREVMPAINITDQRDIYTYNFGLSGNSWTSSYIRYNRNYLHY